jgi:hypothetical protein
LRPLLKTLGIGSDLTQGKLTKAGFVSHTCPGQDELKNAPKEIKDLQISPHSRVGISLTGTISDGAVLLHVIQESGRETIGGLSVLILPHKKERK